MGVFLFILFWLAILSNWVVYFLLICLYVYSFNFNLTICKLRFVICIFLNLAGILLGYILRFCMSRLLCPLEIVYCLFVTCLVFGHMSGVIYIACYFEILFILVAKMAIVVSEWVHFASLYVTWSSHICWSRYKVIVSHVWDLCHMSGVFYVVVKSWSVVYIGCKGGYDVLSESFCISVFRVVFAVSLNLYIAWWVTCLVFMSRVKGGLCLTLYWGNICSDCWG